MSKNSGKKLKNSPDRHTFQRQKYEERMAKKGQTKENSNTVAEMIDFFDEIILKAKNQEQDPEWCKNNLEYDLRSTEWICEKVKQNTSYAQNLYAALCNNDFQQSNFENTVENTLKILKNGVTTWSCSWRHAGGIIADMREEGDYIDWYCSGIRESFDCDDDGKTYVAEGVVTDEIREDLKQLGWVVINECD